MKANDGRESEIDGHTVGSEEKVDNGDTDSPSANLDQPLWRGTICYLLNDNLSILGKAKIVVCLLDEPFDEESISIWFASRTNHLMKRRKHSPPLETKLKRKLSDSDVQRVSSLRCCKFRCCQSFSWDNTLALRRKFYGSTFELRREIAYAVQGQLHSLFERRKKFLTLSGREVCENAWYSIHGVSRAAYHKYKAAALAGRVNGTHGNSGITRLRPHTIQAEANFATII